MSFLESMMGKNTFKAGSNSCVNTLDVWLDVLNSLACDILQSLIKRGLIAVFKSDSNILRASLIGPKGIRILMKFVEQLLDCNYSGNFFIKRVLIQQLHYCFANVKDAFNEPKESAVSVSVY